GHGSAAPNGLAGSPAASTTASGWLLARSAPAGPPGCPRPYPSAPGPGPYPPPPGPGPYPPPRGPAPGRPPPTRSQVATSAVGGGPQTGATSASAAASCPPPPIAVAGVCAASSAISVPSARIRSTAPGSANCAAPSPSTK